MDIKKLLTIGGVLLLVAAGWFGCQAFLDWDASIQQGRRDAGAAELALSQARGRHKLAERSRIQYRLVDVDNTAQSVLAEAGDQGFVVVSVIPGQPAKLLLVNRAAVVNLAVDSNADAPFDVDLLSLGAE